MRSRMDSAYCMAEALARRPLRAVETAESYRMRLRGVSRSAPPRPLGIRDRFWKSRGSEDPT